MLKLFSGQDSAVEHYMVITGAQTLYGDRDQAIEVAAQIAKGVPSKPVYVTKITNELMGVISVHEVLP